MLALSDECLYVGVDEVGSERYDAIQVLESWLLAFFLLWEGLGERLVLYQERIIRGIPRTGCCLPLCFW